MNALQLLKNKLAAKLSIGDANQAIREAKQLLADPSISASTPEAEKLWAQAKSDNPPKFYTNAQAKSVIALAAAEANGKVPVVAPAATAPTKPAAVAPTAPPAAAKIPAPAITKPAVTPSAVLPTPAAPQANATPAPVTARTKPSFAHLHGMERVSASMKWVADEQARVVRETREQAAAAAPKPEAQAVTAQSIAAAILDEQALRAKQPTGWKQTAQAIQRREEEAAADKAALKAAGL